MHVAIDDPKVISRTFVKAIFEFPFLQCKLSQVFAHVSADNKAALELDLKVGFKEVMRFEDAADGGYDLVLLRMRHNECRWINGKRQFSSAPGLRGSSRGDSCGESERSTGSNLREPPQRHDSLGFAQLDSKLCH
jgi:hypothetical protein